MMNPAPPPARHGGGANNAACRVPLVFYFSVTSGTNI